MTSILEALLATKPMVSAAVLQFPHCSSSRNPETPFHQSCFSWFLYRVSTANWTCHRSALLQEDTPRSRQPPDVAQPQTPLTQLFMALKAFANPCRSSQLHVMAGAGCFIRFSSTCLLSPLHSLRLMHGFRSTCRQEHAQTCFDILWQLCSSSLLAPLEAKLNSWHTTHCHLHLTQPPPPRQDTSHCRAPI